VGQEESPLVHTEEVTSSSEYRLEIESSTRSVMMDTLRMQHRLGLRVMIQLAIPESSQSAPHMVGTLTLHFSYVL